jgi:pyruvate/2-oxoglutarate dehydrogenase complex dihydrolipoamide dehydrogenase (E3) component
VLAAEGRGRLLDAHTVEVQLPDGSTKQLTAKHILLATGGVATKIPIEGSVRDLAALMGFTMHSSSVEAKAALQH